MEKSGARNKGFMDILVSVFKNIWLKRSVALLCWGYTGLLIWVDWLNLAYFLQYDNPTSLFVLYVFINIAALGLMTYTRRQVITMVNVMLLPPIWFVSFILAFGSWYMLLPPLCVIIAIFFICRANETLKTVLGTMYLLMYVVGGAGYVAITLLMGKMTVSGVDTTLRDTQFSVLSSDEHYRIVRYVDKPTGERRTASYYVEDATCDIEFPFGSGSKVLGSGRVLNTKYTSRTDSPVSWIIVTKDGIKNEMLNVEGSIMENPYLAEEKPESEETSEVSSAASKTSSKAARTDEGTADAQTAE